MSSSKLPHRLNLHHPHIRSFLLLQRRTLHHSARLLAPNPPAPPLDPIQLDKPDKFRPPSHPQRLSTKKKPRVTYGRALDDEQLAQQDAKQYPYAFPPKQSFLNWFLTNRSIHVWISLSILTSLFLLMQAQTFAANNAHPELVPHGSLFFRHPLRYVREYVQVWRLHQETQSAAVQARRDRDVDDVRKRREYRRAHGLPEVTGLPALLGLGTVEEERRVEEVRREREEREGEGGLGTGGSGIGGGEEEDVVERRPRRQVKKWFGIW